MICDTCKSQVITMAEMGVYFPEYIFSCECDIVRIEGLGTFKDAEKEAVKINQNWRIK